MRECVSVCAVIREWRAARRLKIEAKRREERGRNTEVRKRSDNQSSRESEEVLSIESGGGGTARNYWPADKKRETIVTREG